jgi:hypothetical protein
MDIDVIMIEVTRNDLRLNIHLNPYLISFSKHNSKPDQQAFGTPKSSLVVEGNNRAFTCTIVGLNPKPFFKVPKS